MNIPDKLTFTKPQTATLVVQQTQKVAVSGLDFTRAGYHVDVNPVAQTVTVTLPGLPRPVKVMGTGTATAYLDGATQQQIRAAIAAQLGLDFSQAKEMQSA